MAGVRLAEAYARDLEKHVWAMNEVQRFLLKRRDWAFVDFTNEGLRGVAAPVATSFPSGVGLGHTGSDRS